MAKQEFTVHHDGVSYNCYLENGKVWYYDEKENPTSSTDNTNILTIKEAIAAVIAILNGHGL